MSIVMVPLDGSPFGEQALPLALSVARRMGAGLQLVRVRPSLPLFGEDDSGAYMKTVAASIESQLTGQVSTRVITDEMGDLQYPPPAPDSVAKALARHAESHADLIVMSTHGRGGVQRAWLGSVADAVLRIAPRPLLLVRPADVTFSLAANADRGINHVLIPLDGSEAAEKAVSFGREMAEAFKARITLLRVTSPLALHVPSEAAAAYMTADPASVWRRPALHYLNEVAAQLRQSGITAETVIVEELSPAPAIVDYATAHGVDLVALTTTGGGNVRRMLLGSVADYVIRKGATPVLVCNTKHLMPSAEHASTTAGTEADLEC